ncbi:MAG: hypothetical protein HKN39_02310 [Flavobacteriales bacterium]|nr:hypothetical protein [Flavobacteriales bacterium]
MNPLIRIKALSLLFLMLCMMAHSAIPHVHHDHESEHDEHSTELADYHHHGHSDDEHSGHDHEHSLFLELMETHSHEDHVHEFLQLEFTAPNYDRVTINSVAVVPDRRRCIVPEKDEVNRLFQAFNEVHYHDPDLHSYSLRGPPILG